MSSRRAALISRFKATTTERLTRLANAIVELERGRGTEQIVEDIGRELHTLKGESRMLGFEPVSGVAHAAEERFRQCIDAAPDGSRTVPSQDGALIRRALEVIRGALLDDASALSALPAVAARLHQSAPTRRTDLPPAPAPSQGSVEGSKEGGTERWVSVHAGRIEELCEQVSAFAAQFRRLNAMVSATAADAPIVANLRARAMPERSVRNMLERLDDCDAFLRDVTEAAWSLRLTPMAPLLADMSRHAQELAENEGKTVRVTTSGAAVELERGIIDALSEPVLHLVRNAVSHGIEPAHARGQKRPEAMLRFVADAVGANVVLVVEDDGRGVDLERVKQRAIAQGFMTDEEAEWATAEALMELLFLHRFSTRTGVDELSGRGVGLDVVRKAVESLGGAVTVRSTEGQGTRFVLTVPTSISKETTLVTGAGESLFGLPCRNIVEVLRMPIVNPDEGDSIAEVDLRGESVPFHSLRALVGGDTRAIAASDRWAVVVEAAGRTMAFGVDAMMGERELLRRAVDDLLSPLDYVAASSTVEDGRLVIVLSIPGLMRRADALGATRRSEAQEEEDRTHGRSLPAAPGAAEADPEGLDTAPEPGRLRVLLVDDSEIVCDLVSEMLVSEGFEVAVALGPDAALESVSRIAPDLLVTDLDMPGMGGLELLERVRQDYPGLPVIVLSAREAERAQQRVAARGGVAYLEKSSFHKSTLIQTISRVLALKDTNG